MRTRSSQKRCHALCACLRAMPLLTDDETIERTAKALRSFKTSAFELTTVTMLLRPDGWTAAADTHKWRFANLQT